MFVRYIESGLSVIPLKHESKAPIIDDWSKYCRVLPSESLALKWDELLDAGKCGIGLCLGEASGIVALDIDTDNPETLSVAQRSPVSKRGAKGETRFFRFKAGVENNSQLLKTKGIEILSTGRQTVLPPSIHPATKVPYKWTSQATLLDIDASDLPELDLEAIDLLPNIAQASSTEIKPTGGRNTALVGIVSAMRTRGETEQTIIEEVYSYDKTHHSPRLFTDASEGFSASDEERAKDNAWLFVNRVSASLIKKGIAVRPFEVQFAPSNESLKPKTFEFKAPPILSGFIARYVSLVVAASKSRVDVISIGGALSTLAAIACNRFRVGSTWPNLYTMCIAQSGFGKGAPQELAKLVLQGSGLLGSANYRSGASMYSYLPLMQERLDIIDEASILFRAMKSGDTWQLEMQELLCSLFSCSNSFFAGVTIKGSSHQKVKSMNDGACYNPCINILAATTAQGFRESFDRSMSLKGLLPRFLIFNQHDAGKWKPYVGFRTLEPEVNDLKSFCDELLKFEKRVLLDTTKADPEKGEQNVGKKYDPMDYPVKDSARDLLLQFDEHYFYKAKADDSEEEAPFFNRFHELATKLALLIAISDAKTEIDVASAQTAIDLVEMQYHNARLLMGSLSTNSRSSREDVVNSVLTKIKKHGNIRRSLIEKNLKGLTKKQTNEIFERLISLGEITEQRGERGGSILLYVGGRDELAQ